MEGITSVVHRAPVVVYNYLLLPLFTNIRYFEYFNMDYIHTEISEQTHQKVSDLKKKLEHLIFVNGGSNIFGTFTRKKKYYWNIKMYSIYH